MATKSYSNLHSAESSWNPAVRNFGIVTVMNAKVFDPIEGKTMDQFLGLVKSEFTTKEGATEQHPILFTQAALKNLYDISKYTKKEEGQEPTELSRFVTRTAKGTEPETYNYTLIDDATINFEELKANEIIALYLMTKEITTLKYLKTANATQEGPTKTVTGGQNASPLIKYGKTARLEMQDALGNAEALEALAGLTVEYFRKKKATSYDVGATDILHATTTFAGHKVIIGDTFVVDAEKGGQIPAYIIFYDFLSDSILSLTQDAEGDATVFDMNGDLGEVKILIGDDKYEDLFDKEGQDANEFGDEGGIVTGVFYSILPQLDYANKPTVIVDNHLD